MRRRQEWIPIALMAASALLGWTESPPEPFVLFSESVAQELRLTDEEWTSGAERTRGGDSGPRVEVRRPAISGEDPQPLAVTASPFDLEIEFVEVGAPVDMASLEIAAKRRFPPRRVDLTDDLLRFVEGQRLRARQLDVPNGRYLIEVAIADVQGRITTAEFRLEVK